MINTTTQIDIDFDKLPEEIQDFVLSDEAAQTVSLIAEEYEIKPEQFDTYALLVLGLMVGSVSVDRFLQEIHYTYHINEEKTQDMLIDLDEALLDQVSYLTDLLQPIENKEMPIAHTETSLPSITQSQAPVRGLLEDHEHLAAHTHDGPVPLSKNGIPGRAGDIHDPHKDEPTYELK